MENHTKVLFILCFLGRRLLQHFNTSHKLIHHQTVKYIIWIKNIMRYKSKCTYNVLGLTYRRCAMYDIKITMHVEYPNLLRITAWLEHWKGSLGGEWSSPSQRYPTTSMTLHRRSGYVWQNIYIRLINHTIYLATANKIELILHNFYYQLICFMVEGSVKGFRDLSTELITLSNPYLWIKYGETVKTPAENSNSPPAYHHIMVCI